MNTHIPGTMTDIENVHPRIQDHRRFLMPLALAAKNPASLRTEGAQESVGSPPLTG
jgi:hypothetical protein